MEKQPEEKLKKKETIVVDEALNEEVVSATLSTQTEIVEVTVAPTADSKSPAQSPPDLGTRYDVLEFVGSGGMGTVWKVYDKDLKETFAIKVLKPELLADEVSLKRFQQEARLAADLTHANIAAIFGPGEDTKGRPYIIMRYVEGESLADILKREGKLAPERAMDIFWQIHAALTHSHMKGIVHRDIKPSNIIVSHTESGGDRVNVIDFSIAKSIYEEFSKTQALTKAVDVFGSPQYMSPEQLLGKEVGPESDYYSLGCVLYEMFTGKPPFTSDNPVELVVMQLNETADMTPVPARYVETLGICLEKAPENRKFLPSGDGHRPSGRVATHFELSGQMKFLAAILPVGVMFSSLIGAVNSAELTTLKVLIIELILIMAGRTLLALSDMQSVPSRTAKEVSAAYVIGSVAALCTGVTAAAVQYFTQSDLPVSLLFGSAGISSAVVYILTKKMDLVSQYDRILKIIHSFGTKNPTAHRANSGKYYKFLDFVVVALSHIVTLSAGTMIAVPILFGEVPEISSTFVFSAVFIVAIAFMRASSATFASVPGAINKGNLVKADCLRQLKLVAIYSIVSFFAAKLLYPASFIEGNKLYQDFRAAKTKEERAVLYDKTLALPHKPTEDYYRVCITSSENLENVDRAKESEILRQVVDNTKVSFSPLRAMALSRLAWYSKDEKQRTKLANEAFELLANPEPNSIPDLRESYLIFSAMRPVDVAQFLAYIAVTDGDVALAQKVKTYADSIPDSKKSDSQKAMFREVLKQAKVKAAGILTAPAPQAPSQ